jgi:hypothetical protein
MRELCRRRVVFLKILGGSINESNRIYKIEFTHYI